MNLLFFSKAEVDREKKKEQKCSELTPEALEGGKCKEDKMWLEKRG